MEQNTVFTICIFVYMFTHQAYAVCDLQTPFIISETAPNGTVIFNTTKPQGTTPSFTIISPTQGGVDAALMDSFLIINSITTFQLINTEVLDLEKFMISYGADITAISLLVTCGGNNIEVHIIVDGVNEYAPVFNNAPYNVTLKESLTVGSSVFSLRSRVTDADVVGNENFFFATHKYRIINDETPSSPTAKTTYTHLEIHVADVDDQPPYFEYPDCPPPCPAPQFVSIIELTHKGPLSIIPAIIGNDLDSLGTPLVYSIKSGNKHNLFTMNPVTGTVNQDVSLNEASLRVTEFILLVEVRKDLPNKDLSSIGILLIKVSEPSNGNSATDKSFDLTIPFVVVCIIFVIVFVLLIVLFIKYRHQQQDKDTKPADVKPETQSQECGVTGNVYEQFNSNNYAILGNMTDNIQDTPVSDGDLS